jgi:hypothetical protein
MWASGALAAQPYVGSRTRRQLILYDRAMLLPSCIRSNASLMRSNGRDVRDHRIDFDLTGKILLDISRQLRAAFDAAKGRAAPDSGR